MRLGSITVSCIAVVTAVLLPGCRREGEAGGARVTQPPSQVTITETRPPLGYLDAPNDGGALPDKTVLTGWALDESGIARVTIQVDGQEPVAASTGLAHPGVAEGHPGIPGNDRAGFAAQMPALSKGPHSLIVTILARDGGKTEIHRRFEIQ